MRPRPARAIRRLDPHVAILVLSGSLVETGEVTEDLEDLGARLLMKPAAQLTSEAIRR